MFPYRTGLSETLKLIFLIDNRIGFYRLHRHRLLNDASSRMKCSINGQFSFCFDGEFLLPVFTTFKKIVYKTFGNEEEKGKIQTHNLKLHRNCKAGLYKINKPVSIRNSAEQLQELLSSPDGRCLQLISKTIQLKPQLFSCSKTNVAKAYQDSGNGSATSATKASTFCRHNGCCWTTFSQSQVGALSSFAERCVKSW